MGLIDKVLNKVLASNVKSKPVEIDENIGIRYSTDWAHKPVTKFVRKLGVWGFMKPAINIYGSPEVFGADRLADVAGPVIFVANHQSHADTTLLLATIPAHLRNNLAIAAGADYFFPNKFAAFVSALFIGAIPIERQKVSKLSVENTMKAVNDGHNLLIFPEGSRGSTDNLQKHKPGAAFIAKRTGAPLVPIYIHGTDKVLAKGKNWPSKAACGVVFGNPIPVLKDNDPRDIAELTEFKIKELAEQFRSDSDGVTNLNSLDSDSDSKTWHEQWSEESSKSPILNLKSNKDSWPNI